MEVCAGIDLPKAQEWRGNVRELEHVIESATMLVADAALKRGIYRKIFAVAMVVADLFGPAFQKCQGTSGGGF